MNINKTSEILAWVGSRIGKPPGWERVVRMFAAPHKCRAMPELCLVRDGLLFIAQPAIPVGWHVTFFGTYEPELRAIFREILRPGGIAVDIGANVGWHTLLMARLVGDEGQVLSAEANPSVRDRLQENLYLNHLRHVKILPYAIAEADGALAFYGPAANDPDSGNGYVVSPDAQETREIIRVEARRLDSIVAAANLHRVDLIKIDVEGFEWRVLEGAAESIAKFRPHIVFEYNSEYAARGGGSPKLFHEFFIRQRYRLFALEREWAKAIELRDWPNCADIWAIPF